MGFSAFETSRIFYIYVAKGALKGQEQKKIKGKQ